MNRELVKPELTTATRLGMAPFSVRTETGNVCSRASGITSKTERTHLGVLRRTPRQIAADRRVITHAVGGGGEYAAGAHQDAANTPAALGERCHFGGVFEPPLVARGAKLGRAWQVIPDFQTYA